MGRKSATETLVKIFQAFLEERTWKQVELAEKVGVSSRQLRRRLLELGEHGLPLERQEDHPHVYWSLPSGWTPGGITLEPGYIGKTIELLQRLPPTELRDDVTRHILTRAGWKLTGDEATVHAGSHGDENDAFWQSARTAITDHHVLELDYESASSPRRLRSVSPQRIWKGRATHLIAFCHEARALRRFHFRRVKSSRIQDGETYVSVPGPEVESFLAESVDGYHGEAPPVPIHFTIPADDAIWVLDDLPDGLHGRLSSRGLEVTGTVTSLPRAAAYVASLAGRAGDLSPELAVEVQQIAKKLLEDPS